MKKIITISLLLSCIIPASAQINARLIRYLDISDTQITFVYGGDIWVMPKSGGTATQITNSPGEESWPRFSPDGQYIAYSASYNGNGDVYVIPTSGGVPTRVTYHTGFDRMLDWHPDGKRILFASRRELGQRRAMEFFLVDKEGGFPQKLKVPYGELASFSPDGNSLAYITKITENYPFKRYRGGLSSDILMYDLKSNTAQKVTDNPANDGKPAWAGDKIYFVSDQGSNVRLNLYSYDTNSKQTKQITQYADFDISYMAAGPKELVFENGGTLYRMDLASEEMSEVPVRVISDLSAEMPRSVKVNRNINSMTASPGAKRIIFEARGELFNVPVKEGFTKNMTQSSGAFDRQPAWSPDGKHIAYWSDRSGENEIYVQVSDGMSEPQKLTNRGKGFGYTLYWSPDSKKIAFIDETNTIYYIEVASKKVNKVDNTYWNQGHGGRFGYTISWSPDSRWIAYTRGQENANNAIKIFDTQSQQSQQVTSAFFSDYRPTFSQDGKYLFYLSDRVYSSVYSDMGDGTWVYPNSTNIIAMALTADAPYLLEPKNDEVEVKKEGAEDEKKDEKKEDSKAVSIDFNDMESRITVLPPKPGNIGPLMSFKGKLAYLRFPNSGSGERQVSLMYYDFEKRESKKIISNVRRAVLSADGKSILVQQGARFGVIQPNPAQKIKDAVPTDGLVMDLVPREEWNQIFQDTWRRHRDFFYDPNMHQVDWSAMREQYGALLKDCRTRWDVSYLQSNLAAELSAGHTYTRGGDVERAPYRPGGYLGVDWELDAQGYKIKRIVQPAIWDTEARSPLDRPGMKVKAGDYVLAVNGIPLDLNKEPYAAFDGLSGKTITLTVSSTGQKSDARDVLLKCMSPGQESYLRYLEWIEDNRKMVDKLSNGQLGYIYMSNTSGQGQRELVRMYYGQLDKKGFIIDERFNGGGQLADRFLELMKRPIVYNLHWRHGRDHTWPIKANTGPMGMLINGWAGSGGDGLPWAFQELKAGPIVGERTLGILVGPATGHQLIDGGGITVPGARLYDNDGHWFWEGEGVKPDIKVWDDPNVLVQGRDPQMERVVEEVLKLLENNAPQMTPAPPLEDRTSKAFNKK